MYKMVTQESNSTTESSGTNHKKYEILVLQYPPYIFVNPYIIFILEVLDHKIYGASIATYKLSNIVTPSIEY